MQDAQPAVGTGSVVKQLAAAVRRRVVDGDHLDHDRVVPARARLAEHGVQALGQIPPDAMYRHDHADQRRLRHRRLRSAS
jgi:hypothetical protein